MSNDENKEVVYVPAYSNMMGQDEDEINLLQLWQVIWDAKVFIIGFTLVATVVAVFYSLYALPVTYKSDTVLLPLESGGGNLGALAGLASSLPIPINLPGGGKSDQIINFLKSRTLRQRLIEKYNLLGHYRKDLWDADKKAWKVGKGEKPPSIAEAVQGNILGGSYAVSQDKKTNLLTIFWVDEDSAFTAMMLERVIAELTYYLDNEFEFDAKREREFVEVQLAKATTELEYWEKQVPNQQLPLATIKRELIAAQTVYTELRRQRELAKITEAKELVRFKVLDPPFVPEQRFKPKRSLICALTMVTSAFFATFLVFVWRAVQGAGSGRENLHT